MTMDLVSTPTISAVRVVDEGGTRAVHWREGGKRKQRTGLSPEAAAALSDELTVQSADRQLPANITYHPGRAAPYRLRLLRAGERVVDEYFVTLEEAVAYRDRAKIALAAGEEPPRRDAVVLPMRTEAPPRTVVEAVWRWWGHYGMEMREQGRIQPTAWGMNEARIERHIEPFFGGLHLEEITVADVKRFRALLAGMPCDADGNRDQARAKDVGNWTPGYATKTAGPIIWILWAALDFAREKGWIVGNPAAGLKAFKPRVQIGKSHTFVWMSPHDSVTLSRHLHAAFSAHFWIRRLCGLRNGEAGGLRMRDVDLENGVLHVTEQAGGTFREWGEDGEIVVTRRISRTKTPAGQRVVGIPPILAELLVWYRDEFRAEASPDDPFLIGPQGGTSNDSLAKAITPPARELGFGEEQGNPPAPHDLRGSFSLDLYNLPGVDHVDRSIVMGHSIQGAIEGGSAVTMGTYTRRHPTIERAVSIAEKLDAHFREATGVTSLIPTGWDELSQRTWISLTEAGLQFGMDAQAVRIWARHGLLESTQRRAPLGQRRGLMVSQESVDALLEIRAARITQSAITAEFGITHRIFWSVVKDHGIRVFTPADDPAAAITGMPGGSNAGTWLDPDGYTKFREVMGVREEWTTNHVPLSIAKVHLSVSPQTLLSLIERGIVTEVPAPAGLYVGRGPEAKRPTRWITVESIDRALEIESTWRTQPWNRSTYVAPARSKAHRDKATAYLTPAEAALRLKVSSNTVRNLVTRGTLPTEEVQLGKRRRALIPEAALEAYKRSIAGGKTDGRATRWQQEEKPA